MCEVFSCGNGKSAIGYTSLEIRQNLSREDTNLALGNHFYIITKAIDCGNTCIFVLLHLLYRAFYK